MERNCCKIIYGDPTTRNVMGYTKLALQYTLLAELERVPDVRHLYGCVPLSRRENWTKKSRITVTLC